MSRIGRGKNFEKNKSRLLHIVAKMFLEKGYHRTTLRDISKNADIAYSSLINIFGSKEGILSELVALVFEYQFETAERLLSGICDDKVLLYATETTLQLYMAESHEHIREMYSVSYSLPETSRIIYDTITNKLEELLSDYLTNCGVNDFYRLEIALGGIMRSFMTLPADENLTMDMKVKSFLQSTFRVLGIPDGKTEQAIEFIARFDFGTIAEEVVGNMLTYLESKT